jgi:hypothetical protein
MNCAYEDGHGKCDLPRERHGSATEHAFLPELIRVPNAADLSKQLLQLHMGLRHRWVGYRSLGEHEADHRLHADRMDHVHKDAEN